MMIPREVLHAGRCLHCVGATPPSRETPCVPGSVAMREASQTSSRGAYSVPALGHTILNAERALAYGARPPVRLSTSRTGVVSAYS
jgi:hypothetical protein